jgi:TonB family protein
MRNAAPILVLLGAILMSLLAGVDAPAQTTPPPSATLAPIAPTPAGWCPLSTIVRDLDDTHTRFAVSLESFNTGRASGTVALWAGDRRYDVPFHNVVAVDSRVPEKEQAAVVVRFPTPITLDGAVVTAIDDGGGMRPCDPWYSPWIAPAQLGISVQAADESEDKARIEAMFLAAARTIAPVEAPTPVADPSRCTTPYRAARTVHDFEPESPQFAGKGTAFVQVLLDPSDKISGVRIERSSGRRALDETALRAARLSEFQGQIFRCRHVMGSYLFSIEFG